MKRLRYTFPFVEPINREPATLLEALDDLKWALSNLWHEIKEELIRMRNRING